MIKHKDSHVDHGLTPEQLEYILAAFHDRNEFFIETIGLPAELGTVPCGLFGPAMGDEPVTDSETKLERRGDRAYLSRLISRDPRPTSKVTIIAGPHTGDCDLCDGKGSHGGTRFYSQCPACTKGQKTYECILYTAFGGPLAPQEPADPSCKDLEASTKFWSEHALSSELKLELKNDLCPDCGIGPLHASESDDLGRCADCAAKAVT